MNQFPTPIYSIVHNANPNDGDKYLKLKGPHNKLCILSDDFLREWSDLLHICEFFDCHYFHVKYRVT